MDAANRGPRLALRPRWVPEHGRRVLWRLAAAGIVSAVAHLLVIAGAADALMETFRVPEARRLSARLEAPAGPFAGPLSPRPQTRKATRPVRKKPAAPLPYADLPPLDLPMSAVDELTKDFAAADAEKDVEQTIEEDAEDWEDRLLADAASAAEADIAAAPTHTFFQAHRMQIEFRVFRSDGMEIGRVMHEFEVAEERYRARSVIEATGLLSLFFTGQVVQESAGALTAEGLRPQRYVVQRPRRVDRVEFDWAASRARVDEGGNQRDWPLDAGAQDLLSVLHQLALYAAERRGVDLSITNGRKFYPARVTWIGEERIDTDLGSIRTVHMRSVERGEDTSIDVWIAPDHGYLPVKVRIAGSDGDGAEQVVSRIGVQ